MATARQKGVKASKPDLVRVNLRLEPEQARRLFVFSVMENQSAGDIVSRLIADHLKGWSMPGRITARATQPRSAEIDDRVEAETEIAA
jgi:hypothetical protein